MTLKTFRHRQITLRKWGRKATNLLKTASHCIQKCRHYEASYVQHKVMIILNCLKRSCPRAQSRVLLWRSKGRGSWGHKPLHGAANSRWECQTTEKRIIVTIVIFVGPDISSVWGLDTVSFRLPSSQGSRVRCYLLVFVINSRSHV